MSELKMIGIQDGGFVELELGTLAELMASTVPGGGVTPVPTLPPTHTPTPAPDSWTLVKKPKMLFPDVVYIPVGAREAHIPLTADLPIDMTVYVDAKVRNRRGGGSINVGNPASAREFLKHPMPVWRPGDDEVHYLTVSMVKGPREAGDGLEVVITPVGFRDEGGKVVRIIYQEGAANALPDPMPFHRAPRNLSVDGPAKATLVPSEVVFTDSGYDVAGTPVWRSRLAHGYVQETNGEIGLYMSDEVFPEAEDPITYDPVTDAVALKSCRLTNTAVHDRVNYDHQAAMLNGQKMDEWCGMTGLWTARLTCPDREFSWPAFWLIGRDTDTKRDRWPPEIDIMEQFRWGRWPRNGRLTSCGQHAGRRGSNKREIETSLWCRVDEDTAAGPHDYAVVVTEDEVTFFFDGMEISSQVNMCGSKENPNHSLFPMLNVAVFEDANEYDDGSGTMLVHGAAHHAEGVGYTIS